MSNSTIVEILKKREISQPQDTAYIFLKDGENKTVKLTYGELAIQAKAIAVQLQQLVKPGDRVLLVYPYNAGLEFIIAFFGCLFAGVVAVPCHPPLNRLTITEVQTRLISAGAKTILTESNLLPKLNQKITNHTLNWLDTTKIKNIVGIDFTPPQIKAEDLAFLQYTSGSTGEPKGVMINHHCLLQNQEMLKQSFGHTARTIGMGWLPLFHDMGLIGNVIQPVYLGVPCIMMSPVSFVQKPIRWLQAITKYGATTSGAPNFAYDLLCDRVQEEKLGQLDLSSWDLAFCGAEPVESSTIERFSQKFAVCGFKKSAFYPCYGMAEATLMITGGKKAQPSTVKYFDKVALEENKVIARDKNSTGITAIVSAGNPWLDGKIAIVDPQSLVECEPNRVGEIWFSAASVASGYWQLPEKTQATFRAYLNSDQDRSYLRTGDLGFISDGELYITGRLNSVMVFWGLNHYPQNIEKTVSACHPALKANCGAAISVNATGKDRLVIVQEIERSYRKCLVTEEVIEAIRWAIFQEHFIDVYAIALLKPGQLPKTSSGKVQRNICKEKFLNNSLETMHLWYIPDVATSDVTGLFKRYTNPFTYLKIYAAIARGKLRRSLYLLSPLRSKESGIGSQK